MTNAQTAGLLPAYLVQGSDELRVRRVVARLKTYVAEGFEVFDLDERDATADMAPDELIGSLETMPIGGGQRIVVLHGADHLPKPVSEAIVGYLANPNPGCTLCLVADKLARNTRLYKAVAALGPKAVVECEPKKRWELPQIVVQLGQRRGITFDRDAAEELVSRVGESTVMLDTQVETLAQLCRANGRVTRSDVEAHVTRIAEVKPWDFLDALSSRDATRSLALYQLMVNPSEIALNAMVVGRLRELVCAKALAARGAQGELARELGKQAWQVKNHVGWARRFGADELRVGLAACAACERALKSGGDAQIEFTRMVLAVCGRAA
jgi:DNA polymerase-3 subunit delta